MKKSIFTLLSLLAVVLFLNPNFLLAQQNDQTDSDKIIVITKIVDEDGNVTIERKTLTKGFNFEHNLEQLKLDGMEGKDVELKFFSGSNGVDVLHIEKSFENDETVFFFRHAQKDIDDLHEELRSLRISIAGDEMKLMKKCEAKAGKTSQKALLGIFPESHAEGVLITGIVKGSGAEAAGLQKGDIITGLSGQDVDSNRDLTSILATHKPGETIAVAYLRNGNAAQTNSTLTAKKQKSYSYNYNYNYDYNYNYSYNHGNYSRDFSNRNMCKPFIGVYTSRTSKGMKVSSVIDGTAAERSYIQPGDIITALDGVSTPSHSALVRERDKHEPGDYFTLTIISGESTIDVEAQFDDCPTDEEPVIEEEIITQEIPQIQPTINNNLQLESFDAYPNPTYGAVNIRFQGEAVATKVKIVDVTGKTVYEEDVPNFDGVYNRDLNLEKATHGALIVYVQQGHKMFTKSLILLPKA